MHACDLVSVELRLDRIEAELAAELPPHMRSFAQAYARGAAPPPAPEVLLRPSSVATARAALAHPLLADRGLALLRLTAPLAIEADPQVAAARAATPSWDALAALAAARDAAAVARFGRRAIDVLHRLHGSAGPASAAPPVLPAPLPGWFAPDRAAPDPRSDAIALRWQAIGRDHAATGTVRFERGAGVRPRAFAVAPGREVIVVIPAEIAAPADRFAALHELGHAFAALALPAGIPRAVDEAAAAYIARAIERDADPWHSPLAGPARARRTALAEWLDRIERALPEIGAEQSIDRPTDRPTDRPINRPPWALWHDPGAQAAYVAAEALADQIAQAIGTAPAPGQLAAQLAALRDAIDRRDTAL
jgi:hypothetical protein